MQRVGSPSWRFTESAHEGGLHVALFIRDALRLPVAAGAAIPPPLLGEVPDHHADLSAQERDEMAGHWSTWWSALVDCEQGRSGDIAAFAPAGSLMQLQGDRERVGAPPDFIGLADRPGLQRAAVDLFPAAHRWVSRSRHEHDCEHGAYFQFSQIRETAEEVSLDRGVDIGKVAARAIVLETEGRWWHVVGPGTVVCAVGATGDSTAHQVLRRAFESGLTS